MNWLNPLAWFAALGAYARAHFWAWNISSVWSWVGAFGTSMAYPEWARDLATTYWPYAREAAVTLWELAWGQFPGP